MFEIVKPGTRIDFLGKWKLAAALSLGALLIGALAIPIRGFRLGVDFAGGSEVQVRFTGDAPVGDAAIRDVLGDVGIINPSVVRVGTGNEFLLKFKGERRIEAQAAPAEPDALDEPVAEPQSGGEITARTDRIVQLEEALVDRVGPLEVMRVDFRRPPVAQAPKPMSLETTVSGTGHAVAFWFDLHLDDEITLSNRPGDPLCHWRQGLQFLERDLPLTSGQRFELAVGHTDASFIFRLPSAP